MVGVWTLVAYPRTPHARLIDGDAGVVLYTVVLRVSTSLVHKVF